MDSEACGEAVQDINTLTVVASESYKDFVGALQTDIKAVLYDRPTKATIEYFTGKTVMINGQRHVISAVEAQKIQRYLIRNDYVDDDDRITDTYRTDPANESLAALPDALTPIADGVHTLIQGIFDDSVLGSMITDAHEAKVKENPLNDNFYKQEFQKLWGYINHKYAYTVSFDSDELIGKSIESINDRLYVSQLQYTTTIGTQGEQLTGQDRREEIVFKGILDDIDDAIYHQQARSVPEAEGYL